MIGDGVYKPPTVYVPIDFLNPGEPAMSKQEFYVGVDADGKTYIYDGSPSWDEDSKVFDSPRDGDFEVVSIFDGYNLKPCSIYRFKFGSEHSQPVKIETNNVFHNQVSGEHYKNKAIQPIHYIEANKLGFCEGNAIKYITRHGEKNGKQDLEKAIHYLQMLIAFRYPNETSVAEPPSES